MAHRNGWLTAAVIILFAAFMVGYPGSLAAQEPDEQATEDPSEQDATSPDDVAEIEEASNATGSVEETEVSAGEDGTTTSGEPEANTAVATDTVQTNGSEAGSPDAVDPADTGETDLSGDVTMDPDEADTETADTMDDATETAGRDWGRLQPFADLVEAGGPVIMILVGLSVISLAIVLVKLIQFTVLRVGDRSFINPTAALIRQGKDDDALAYLTARRGVVADVMTTALRGKMLSGDETHVREEVTRVAQIKLDGLERGLPLLSLIATLSPLLGLLGTVLGMIDAFQQLENAGDRVDPAILSGGIWEALLTTAAGLTIAIPAAAFHAWMQGTVDAAGQKMEDAATQVFTASIYSSSVPAGPVTSGETDTE